MGFLDNIPVITPLWKTIIGTPVKYFNKKSNGTLDKVANGLIGFVGALFPSWAAELAKQWDSDMGYDRKAAVMKALELIKNNNNKISLNQIQIEKLNDSLASLYQTAARATNKYQTDRAIRDDIKRLTLKSNELSAIGNAAAQSLGDVSLNSPLTTGEINRRINNVSDLMEKYEKGNNNQ